MGRKPIYKAFEGLYFYIEGKNSFFMNTNEECLLLFLKNPGRINESTIQLKNFIFSRNDNIINREFAVKNISNPINNVRWI